MAAPKLSECKRVLVVEGYSDLLFCAELLEHIGKHKGVFIKDMVGKGNLKTAALETFLSPALLAEKEAIAVIRDADDNAEGACRSLEGALTAITKQQVKVGEWTAGPPRIGLFVVPGATAPGEIESLVWQAWSKDPANESAVACIDGFLSCMTSTGLKPASPDKARIGALLSVRYDDDPRLGPGARAKVFDFARPELAARVDFLREL